MLHPPQRSGRVSRSPLEGLSIISAKILGVGQSESGVVCIERLLYLAIEQQREGEIGVSRPIPRIMSDR